jgi:hypothetical protein
LLPRYDKPWAVCDELSRTKALAFIQSLPRLQEILATDMRAAGYKRQMGLDADRFRAANKMRRRNGRAQPEINFYKVAEMILQKNGLTDA